MTTQESILRIQLDSRQAYKNGQLINNELQAITKNGNSASKSMDVMSVATRNLAASMAGIVTVGTAISKMDAYTNLQNRLKLVTGTQQELTTAMNDTFKIAQNTAQAWDSVSMIYQRFADNAKTLGITLTQTASLTETVAKAIAVSGASASSAEAALMQFGQALASGVLRGEEFNSIAEQAPALLKAIANGLNVGIGELRAMAAEGQITGDVLVKSLEESKKSIDELFGKTDFSIGNSFTQLNNAVIQFTGEAGKASGSATFLSNAIKTLADNLSLVANIAVIGGVALLTKTIAAQTVAIYGSITGVMARRAADLAALESQAQLAGLEVQRTRQVAALALTEVHLARQELNSAVTRTERAAATVRLTQAEIALSLAQKQKTAATIADTAAQNANNAARSRGAALFAMVGGLIGAVTLGVTALAASYMYMSSRAAEANKKLEEQGQIANKTKDELLALRGAEKAKASSDLKEAFAAENEELERRGNLVEATIAKISSMNTADAETAKILRDVRTGAISYTEAYKKLNETQSATPDIVSKLREQIDAYDESSIKSTAMQKALKVLGFEVKTVGNEAQNAANKVAENTTELDKNTTAAEKAAKAQKLFKDSMWTDDFSANFTQNLLKNTTFTQEQIQKLLDVELWARKNNVDVTNEMRRAALGVLEIEERNNAVFKERNKLQQEQNKESDKQLKKTMTIDKLIARGEGNYNSINRGKAGDTPNSKLNLTNMTVGQIREKQKKGEIFAAGKYQAIPTTLQGAIDAGVVSSAEKFSAEVQERIFQQYLVALKRPEIKGFITGSSKSSLDKALLGSAKEFASVANPSTGKSYYAGKGDNKASISAKEMADSLLAQRKIYQENIALGMSANEAWVNSFNAQASVSSSNLTSLYNEQQKLLEQQAEARKKIEFDTLGKIEQERERLKDKFIEIDEAAFSPEQAQKMREFYQKQSDLNIEIYQKEMSDKINSYSNYLKSEEQLLTDSYNDRKFSINKDSTLTKKQREEITQHLDAQLQKEIALISLAKEERLFQMNQQFMSETEMINARYALETKKLIEIQDLKERQAQDEANRRKRDEAIYGVMSQAQAKWNDVRPNQNANNPYIQNEENRRNQLNTSGEVYRAGMADIANREQDPNADFAALNAEKEALLQTHTQNMLDIQKAYEQARLDLNMSYGEQIAGSMASIFKDMAGEQSTAYKAMFAIEKGFTIAKAALAMQRYIAEAFALPFPANLPAVASAVAQGAQIASAISSIKATGFYGGGYTGNGNPRDEAGVVHKEEYVMTAKATKRIGVDQLNALNYGGGKVGGNTNISVSIENYGTSKDFRVQQISESEVRIIARDEAVKAVAKDLRNPNGLVSTAVKQTKNVVERR